MPSIVLRWSILALSALSVSAYADTIFLCRNYGGGEFWSNAHCSTHNSLIVRMTEVPSGIPFDQQVNLASQARAAGEQIAQPPRPAPVPPSANRSTATQEVSECAALDEKIRRLDALARQPHSGPSQDHLRDERRRARDRQFALRCR